MTATATGGSASSRIRLSSAEGTKNYQIDELKWPVEIYNCIVAYMDRAVDAVKPALRDGKGEDGPAQERFLLQYRRIAALRAVWRNQRNVLRAASIIEFFTGAKKDEYWNVIRKDESFHTPATYRRFFLEAMDDEAANAREVIRLIRESDVKLFNTGAEDTFVLPDNLAELLGRRSRSWRHTRGTSTCCSRTARARHTATRRTNGRTSGSAERGSDDGEIPETGRSVGHQ